MRFKMHTTDKCLPSIQHSLLLTQNCVTDVVDGEGDLSSVLTCVLVREDTAMFLQYGWQHLPRNKGPGDVGGEAWYGLWQEEKKGKRKDVNITAARSR